MDRYPHERYLRYLAAFSASTPAELIDTCVLAGYPAPTNKDAKELVEWAEGLPSEETDEGLHYTDEAVSELDSLGVTIFLEESSSLAEARRINSHTKTRAIVQRAAIAGEEDCSKIATLVSTILSRKYSEAGIGLYLYLYWNTEQVVGVDWRRVYAADPPTGRKLTEIAMSQNLAFAMWSLGYRVAVDATNMWETVRHEGFMRFLDTSGLSNSMPTAQAAKAWVEIAATAEDKLEKTQPLSDMLLAFMNKVRIAPSSEEPPGKESLEKVVEGGGA